MPKDAYHSICTPVKQQLLEQIVSQHIQNHKANHKGKLYVALDLNAGDGKNGESEGSSPMFYDLLSKNLKHWKLACFEQNTKFSEQLIDLMLRKTDGNPNVNIYNLDNRLSSIYLARFRKFVRGIAYCDPVGCFQTSTLAYISEHYPNIDILINCNAVIYKRLEARFGVGVGGRLQQELEKINKPHWFISQYRGIHQWCFLYGTNEINSADGMTLLANICTDPIGRERFTNVNYLKSALVI